MASAAIALKDPLKAWYGRKFQQQHQPISSRKISRRRNLITCSMKQRSGEYYGYDLYDLLGIESSAHQVEIKKAYRWLQKRCHPDVTGKLGHDMSILLNDAYSILSDPDRRTAYDAVRSEWIEYEGYTGETLYSKWLGSSSESRGVFVDEIRCIGCLKCALIAPNTFAIERRFGRARAVGQWGDSEPIINDAVRACPVDCIMWVDKSKLPALEFVMSKQPRIAVHVDTESSGGERVVNILESAEMFLKRSQLHSKESPAQKTARMAAANAIEVRAGRWWKNIFPNRKIEVDDGALIPLNMFQQSFNETPFSDAKLKALYVAAAQRRRDMSSSTSTSTADTSSSEKKEDEEYWAPSDVNPIDELDNLISKTKAKEAKRSPSSPPSPSSMDVMSKEEEKMREVLMGIPIVAAVVGGVNTGISGTATMSWSFGDDEIMREVGLSLVRQSLLSAAAWYMITSVVSAVALLATSNILFSSRPKK